jgi:transcriptional regulator with XRE-family HTH domain
MNIAIAENVKRLRRQRDMTQDELAAVLGVSAQSVSKWEVGASYPELETIPLIANFFDISVDELLGMANIRDEARIAAEVERTHEIFRSMMGKNGEEAEDYMDRVREIERNLALEFPHNDEAQIVYASRLLNDNEPAEALAIIERVLARSTDTNLRANVAILQINAYHRLGHHDKADELTQRLPAIHQCRESVKMMFKNISGGLKREDVAETRDIAWLADSLYGTALGNILTYEQFLNIRSDEEKKILLLLEEQRWRLKLLWAKDDLNGEFDTNSVRGHTEHMAQELCSVLLNLAIHFAAGEPERAAGYIEQFVELCTDTTLPPITVGRYDREKNENTEEKLTLREFFAEMRTLELPEFDPIRANPRFINAVKTMNAK